MCQYARISCIAWCLFVIGQAAAEDKFFKSDGDAKDVMDIVQRANSHLRDRKGEGLSALFDDDGQAYLPDGRTILRGDQLARLASEEAQQKGVKRTTIRLQFLADDVCLVIQRGDAPDGTTQQESMLLIRRDNKWRIRHFQVCRRAPWAGANVARRSAEVSDERQPQIIRSGLHGSALADINAAQRTKIRTGIESLMEHHDQGYQEGGAEIYASSFTEDAALLPAGGQAILLDRQTIHDTVKAVMPDLRAKTKITELTVLGPKLALVRLEGTYLQPDGAPYQHPGFQLGLWFRIAIRQDDGSWLWALQHNTAPLTE